MTEGAESPYQARPRLDRLFDLAEAEAYPGTGCLDSVLFWPLRGVPGETRVRFWLRTEAPEARAEINAFELSPVGRSSVDPSWLDLGTHPVASLLEHHWVFGIMRFRGLAAPGGEGALFVMTTQVDAELRGGRSAIEERLWGISRSAVGTTTITPSRVQAGDVARFKLEYTVGA
ncbi:MAG: hypothetical protein HON70_15625, partial [Lentisphaerae bacterium]|nr:hypothetical protein [Lentisphaerota bacterium]